MNLDARSSISRRARLIMAALGVVTAFAGNVLARDLCLSFDGGGEIVLKGTKVPARNRCTPFGGFENKYHGSLVSGSVCLGTSGSQFYVHYSAHDFRGNTSYVETATCLTGVPYPQSPGSGTCTGTYLTAPNGQATHFNDIGRVRYCDVDLQD